MLSTHKQCRAGFFNVMRAGIIAAGVLGFSLSSQVAFAQDISGTDQASKTELKRKLGMLTSYAADFSQSITDNTGKELQSSSGKLTLLSPNMLRWETQLPDETLLIADGVTVWNADPFVEQVTIMQQNEITQNNPLMLLVSDDEVQWQNVDVKKHQSGYMVVSKDDNANIVSLTIEFDGETLSRLQSTDRQKQQSLLIFSNIEQNKPVELSVFSFDIPSNYIVDDQRSQ